MNHYAYVSTYATYTEDDPDVTVYAVDGSPVHVDDLEHWAEEIGTVLAIWEGEDLETRAGATRPDWVGVLDAFGDVLRLDALYVDRVLL